MLVIWDHLDSTVIAALLIMVLGSHQENDLMKVLITLLLSEYVLLDRILNIFVY